MKLSMFRTVPLSIIRSLFTVHSAMVYVIQVVHEVLNDKLYLHVSGEFTFFGGWVGASSRFVFVEGVWIGSV